MLVEGVQFLQKSRSSSPLRQESPVPSQASSHVKKEVSLSPRAPVSWREVKGNSLAHVQNRGVV